MRNSRIINSEGQPSRKGMTLIEVLIILSAIAIVVLISVPGSSMVLEHYRLKSASGDLLAGLAETHRETVMAGRTHGQHAIPITFGFK